MITKYLICCLIFFGLLGCSRETGITRVIESQTNATSDNSIPSVKTKVESPVEPIGVFMKVKTDGEHASGYDVRLWKRDEKFYGLISVHRGLMGDPPTGLLENVQFDSKTTKFSFRAKLSIGLTSDKNGGYVPSHDVFEFEGVLTNKKLEGNLLITDELCADKCPQRKKITLPRSKEWSEGINEYQSYAEWKAFVDEILKRRGPEW